VNKTDWRRADAQDQAAKQESLTENIASDGKKYAISMHHLISHLFSEL